MFKSEKAEILSRVWMSVLIPSLDEFDLETAIEQSDRAVLQFKRRFFTPPDSVSAHDVGVSINGVPVEGAKEVKVDLGGGDSCPGCPYCVEDFKFNAVEGAYVPVIPDMLLNAQIPMHLRGMMVMLTQEIDQIFQVLKSVSDDPAAVASQIIQGLEDALSALRIQNPFKEHVVTEGFHKMFLDNLPAIIEGRTSFSELVSTVISRND